MRFGTDGIRGRAGVAPIDDRGAARVGRAAAAWALAQGRPHVLVGRDTRPSSRHLAAAVGGGAAAAGCTVFDGGVLPTAAVALAVAQGRAAVGVMVTASHNPVLDNGFKIVGPTGEKPSEEELEALQAWLDDPPTGRIGGDVVVDEGLVGAWRARVREAGGGWAVGRSLVVDLANGASREAARWLPEVLPGARFVFLGTDGVINEGVGSEHPEALAEAVREHGADAGLAVDGDGDRVVLVDEEGRRLHGDAVAWLLVVTVMSTQALEGALHGRRVVRTPVGDRYLAAARRETGIGLGCEESGHVLLPGMPTSCGLLAGIEALRIAWTSAPSLGEAVAGFVPWPRATAKVAVSAKPPLESVPGLMATIAAAEVGLAGGRVLVRYSGTEPALRVMAEGRDEAAAEAAVDAVVAAARAGLGA
jgi:phosphoglucosamine mutase